MGVHPDFRPVVIPNDVAEPVVYFRWVPLRIYLMLEA